MKYEEYLALNKTSVYLTNIPTTKQQQQTNWNSDFCAFLSFTHAQAFPT